MTTDDYRNHLARLDLSQLAAGRMLGVDPRTARRFASGDQPIPPPYAMLLELMEPQDASDLLAQMAERA